jgi:hypothetical protein
VRPARNWRVRRCRTTELPTAELTAKAARAGPDRGEGAICTTSRALLRRRPRRRAEVMSGLVVNRWARGSIFCLRAGATDDLGRQSGAAFTPARGEDGPARAGAHPCPEAVGTGPAAVIGLECALHGVSLLLTDRDGSLPGYLSMAFLRLTSHLRIRILEAMVNRWGGLSTRLSRGAGESSGEEVGSAGDVIHTCGKSCG